MRTASPWWASLAFGVGLLLTFMSERFLSHQQGLRIALTGLGVGVLIAVAGARVWTMLASRGSRRRVERTLLLCHLGTLLALVLYALTTKWGLDLLGVGAKSRVGTGLTVVWSILMVSSLVPLLMVELSLGVAMRTNFDIDESDEAGVEYYRVREIGWSGLTIAFAAAFLMVTCQVARERNVSKDVSYFKTSSPGQSTRNIIGAASEPVRVHLFFPDPNEVKEQVLDYFNDLRSASGKLEIHVNDRISDAALAEKYKVQKEGVVVIARGQGEGEKFFSLELDTDLEKARKSSSSKLRNLDREINSLLMKIVRDKRKAYVIKGHGEVTDPDSVPPDLKGRVPDRGTTKFRALLAALNYEIKDLTIMDLARDVPEDATMVILMAPAAPLQPAEWEALDRYLTRGGRLLIALDPRAEPSMGKLEGRLGLKMLQGTLIDDKAHLPQRGSITERLWVMTSQFTSHATTTAASRTGPLITMEAGALEDVPFSTQGEAPKKTITIRSMDSAWLDYNQNFQFDPSGPLPEKKQRWNIGAVVEGPKVGGKDGFRAVVYSDVDLFVDVHTRGAMGRAQSFILSGNLLVDTVRWLGGEEVFAGEIVSEEDKPIQHTKNEDVAWFTVTTIGAPLLVLTLGLVGTWARRRRGKKVSS